MKRQRRSILLTWLQAPRTQQQRASVFRAGLAASASTRQIAAQRSSIARLQATAQKRLAPPQLFLAPAMTMGQAPLQVQKMHSRQPRRASRKNIRQTVSLRAGRAGRADRAAQLMRMRTQHASAQLARGRAERASTLAQRRAQAAGTDASAAQTDAQATDTPASAIQTSAPATETDAAAAQTDAEATEAPASAPQPSRAARVKPGAHKQRAHASTPSALASGTQHASRGALDRFGRQPRVAAGKAATTPERARAAARRAHLMQSIAQRSKGLSLKRDDIIGGATSAAEDGTASGAHSPVSPPSQEGPTQVIWCLQPAQ